MSAQFKPGDFSLGLTHEFARAFGRKGGSPGLLQNSIDDQGLMERLVLFWQSGGVQPTTNQRMVRRFTPKRYFFGIEEWIEHFGGRFGFSASQIASTSEIPWTEEQLKHPSIDQPHFLFLGLDKLDGDPLTVQKWGTVFPERGEQEPKVSQPAVSKGICRLRWYHMPIGIVGGSYNLSYKEQVAMLPSDYEVPSSVERITANILFYLLNGEYLDYPYAARTSDRDRDKGSRYNQGRVKHTYDSSCTGISDGFWEDEPLSDFGIAASMKLPSVHPKKPTNGGPAGAR